MDTFGERIRHLRERFGLTKADLARRIGVDPSHISQIENHNRTASDLLIKAVSKEFSVSEDWLRDGRGPEMEPAESVIKKQMELYGPEALAEAFLDQAGNIKASGPQPVPWPLTEPIPIDAADLRRMVDYLISLWLDGDPRMRSWAAIQFEQAFPQFRTTSQKKPGVADEGPGPRSAASS